MASSESSDAPFGIPAEVQYLDSDVPPEDENTLQGTNILCMLWKSSKMGAAYFNWTEKSLYVYEAVSDPSPEFLFSSSMYREVDPKFLLTIGKLNDDFTKHLIDLVSFGGEGTVTTDTERSLPENMFLLPLKEYSFETCRGIISQLCLLVNPDATDEERELHINSFLNTDDKMSTYAAGALVKYLDKNWAHFVSRRENLQYLEINQICMKGHVLMDATTLRALQVFQQCSHDANFKRGLQGSNREGLSIFKLFSSSCKSKLGHSTLRSLLQKPTNDIRELDKRLEFISFVLHPNHHEFIESLQDNLKKIVDVTGILVRIKNSRANRREWHILHKAIYHAIFVGELASPYQETCELLNEFYDSITPELLALEDSINKAIDFADTKLYGRPVIKMGLDESLDAKKMSLLDISQHVAAAAEIAAQQLPPFLHECAIVYLPEMGHLISINEWEPDCNPEILERYGFRFVFNLKGTLHYKNPICLEMDQNFGGINADIIAHENRILQRLSSFVIKYNKDIRAPLTILSLIDSLIAIAKVSAQNNYVRPQLNTDNIIEIQDCRHPLLELVANFEPNDFFSGQDYSHIKIITGPNGSGKSVYLKEVALVIYLAHVGSYVPAKFANIGMMFSIHSRIQATESAAVRLSAFMIDAIQTTQAIRNAKCNSLILLDEFGKGTTIDEGCALLMAVLNTFCQKDKNCPHILVSTHHQNISNYLPDNSLIEYLKMQYAENNGTLLFLFKVGKGISKSFALDIARQVGIEEDIIKRAKELQDSNNRDIIALYNRPGYPSNLRIDFPECD